MIFCKSRKSAERTLENIIPFIEGKFFLKVNRKKTKVAHISKVKYLGYTYYRYKGKCRFRVHQKSVEKMKNKIRGTKALATKYEKGSTKSMCEGGWNTCRYEGTTKRN